MALTAEEARDLRRLAGFMIPADAALGVPGAHDPAIQADLTATLERDEAAVCSVLARLEAERFAMQDDAAAEALAMRVLAVRDAAVLALGRVVLAAYYRDDRVVRSLGRVPGAPFPRGHDLPQGDWSLLDAVKARTPLWRDDRGR